MISPLQSGDGSQASTESAGTVPFGGFGPSPTPRTQLAVDAPLNVNAAPSQAHFLAAQLEQSLGTLRWPMMMAERGEAVGQARASEAQGAADATLGNIDPKLAKADMAYRQGAVRVTAQSHAITAIQAAQQQLSDPNSGWGNLPVADTAPGAGDGLVSKLDQFFAQRLGGLERDPTAATAIAPLIQHAMNEFTGHTLARQAAAKQQEAISNATTLAAAQATHGGAVFDYSDQFNTLKSLYGGNGVAAKQALDSALVQQAVASKNASILGYIQPAPGQSALAPKTQLMISEAQASIARANKEAAAQYTQAQSFGVLAGWDKQLAGKTPIPFAQIGAAVQSHQITPDQGLAYYEKSLKLGQQLDQQTAASQILASGTPWWNAVGAPKPGSKSAPFTKQDFTSANDAAIDTLPPQQRDMAAIMRTRQYGLVYSPLAARVNSEPLNTASGVKDVLGTFNTMDSLDASVTGQYFSDPKRLAEVHQALTLRQSGMSDQNIADYFTKHGGATAPADAGVKASEIDKALSTTAFQSGGLFGFGKVDMGNIANPGDVRSRTLALAHQMATSGACTGATCATAAANAIVNQSYVVKLAGGRSLVLPRGVNDPPASQSEPALQQFFNTAVPAFAKAAGRDPSDLRLLPNPSQPGTYTLTDSTGLPVSDHTFTLQGMVSQWLKQRGDAVRAQQQTAAANAVNAARMIDQANTTEMQTLGR